MNLKHRIIRWLLVSLLRAYPGTVVSKLRIDPSEPLAFDEERIGQLTVKRDGSIFMENYIDSAAFADHPAPIHAIHEVAGDGLSQYKFSLHE